MTAAITLNDLTLGYDGHPAVHHLSGAFARGSLTAICGPNGAGKSTLVKAMAGVLKPLGGAIHRHGTDAKTLGYLPQAADIDRTFPINVYDMTALGCIGKTGLFGAIGRAHRGSVLAAIRTVGLEGFEHRAINTLSGGQMQRLLFARLLLQDARLILLDEPFTAVDERTSADMLALIAGWQAEGRTVIAVLHDLGVVRSHFPQTLLLARECVAWGAAEDVLTPQNLAQARRMSEAFDEAAAACERVA